MKKICALLLFLCFIGFGSQAGDVRISAKSTLIAQADISTQQESSWWDDVSDWVTSLF